MLSALLLALVGACSGDDNGGGPGGPGDGGIPLGDGATEGAAPCDCASAACQAPPAIDATTVTSFYESTRFLYEGLTSGQCAGKPLQTGVAPGTIQANRAAAVVGKVLDVNAQPIAGVTLTIVGHAEYGQTISGPDGSFVMVINGGAPTTVRYAKNGNVAVQRHVPTSWLRFAHLPDVVMRAASATTSAVTLSASSTMADGAAVSDSDGSRTSHVYFAPNTTATAIAANGSKTSLSTFHLRMTELTTGASGQASMPADLPPQTAYTYCTAFDVDEAPDAQRVELNPPAVAYVDNFLGFNAGTGVPAGAYAPGSDTWEPANNGVALTVLTAGASTTIDADGDGKADSALQLAALGVTSDELATIGSRFTAGASFWRVPLPHFSAWDFNPGWALLKSAVGAIIKGFNEAKNGCSGIETGSIIRCESAGLGEVLPLAGTGLTLMYASERQRAYDPSRTLDLQITGDTLPPGLASIVVTVDVAGQRLTPAVPLPTPRESIEVTWDGNDVFGRPVQGTQQALVAVDYLYHAVYQNTAAFGGPSDGSKVVTSHGDAAARGLIAVETTTTLPMTAWDERGLGENGWTLAAQHVLDPYNDSLHFGYGANETVQTLGTTLWQVAGRNNQSPAYTGDGGPAAKAILNSPHGLAVSADGTVYVSDENNHAVRKIDPSGIITTVAGTGTPGFSGDGGPATSAQLDVPYDLALGPDGSLYIADSASHRVRKVSPTGTISTFAGNGSNTYAGDGGAATSAGIQQPHGLAFGPDGSFYVTDSAANNLRKIAPNGSTITTIAGANTNGTVDVGGPATAAKLGNPTGVDVARDGTIYVADRSVHVIWRIRPNGIIERFAGTVAGPGFFGDGGPAVNAQLDEPHSIAVAPDGTVYVTDGINDRVRAIDPSGTINTVAGGGSGNPQNVSGSPLSASFALPRALKAHPDGSLWVTDYVANTVLHFAAPRPLSVGGNYVVPSHDGSVAYVFDLFGHHLRTVDPVTGVALLTFNYDPQFRVSSVVDRDGNTTTFARDGSGCLTTVTSPWGHVTSLTCDTNGFLASAIDPTGAQTKYVTGASGLLQSLTSPRGDTNTFLYDTTSDVKGRLIKDTEPWGGFKALTYARYPAHGWENDITTAQGRTTTHEIYFQDNKDEVRQQKLPDGHYQVFTQHADASTRASTEHGGITVTTPTGDPRFDMMAPAGTTTYSTPAANGLNSSLSRAVTLASSGDPTAPATYSETATVGGHGWTRAYDAASRTWLITTPQGRTVQVALDAKGHVLEVDAPSRAPARAAYDPQGRVTTLTQDTRSTSFTYDARSNVATSTDPLGHTWSYGYDAVGRTTSVTRADGQKIGTSYDPDGNVLSITPPGKAAHDFTYSAGGVPQAYKPPPASGTAGNDTLVAFSQDLDLSTLTRADSQVVTLGYDPAGRLSSTTSSAGVSMLSYDATFGSLVGVVDPDGESVAITNDAELITGVTWSGPVAGAVSYQFDTSLRVSQETAGGTAVSYGYDGDSLLTSAGAETLSRFAADGYLSGTTLGVASDALTYSQYGELATHVASISGTAIFTQDFTRDALGRVSSLQETIDGATHTYGYTYDLANRLATVTIDGAASSSYSYDANGNATSATVRGVATTGVYDAQDRMTSYAGATYDWTAQGELLAKHAGAATTSYATDSLGRLQSVSLPSGHTVSYVYDGSNRRVGKKLDGVLQQGFLYRDAIKPVVELDGAGSVVSRFVYGSSPLVPDYVVRGGNTYRIFADQIGSPRVVVDVSSGSVVERIDYDERGNTLKDTNPGFLPFGFAGGIVDRDTGLIRFGARDYDPSSGRWITKEPLGFGGSDNFYRYADGDPINFLDPDGEDAFGTAVGSAIGQSVGGGYGGDLGARGGAELGALGGPETEVAGLGLGAAFGGELGRELGGSIGASVGDAVGDLISAGLAGIPCDSIPAFFATGRGGNRLGPDPGAGGAHSTFKRGPNGRTSGYTTWEPNPRNPNGFDPSKRFDGAGRNHFNKATQTNLGVPHVHDATAPGGVRAPDPWEIP